MSQKAALNPTEHQAVLAALSNGVPKARLARIYDVTYNVIHKAAKPGYRPNKEA